jgi:hypothetical protein
MSLRQGDLRVQPRVADRVAAGALRPVPAGGPVPGRPVTARAVRVGVAGPRVVRRPGVPARRRREAGRAMAASSTSGWSACSRCRSGRIRDSRFSTVSTGTRLVLRSGRRRAAGVPGVRGADRAGRGAAVPRDQRPPQGAELLGPVEVAPRVGDERCCDRGGPRESRAAGAPVRGGRQHRGDRGARGHRRSRSASCGCSTRSSSCCWPRSVAGVRPSSDDGRARVRAGRLLAGRARPRPARSAAVRTPGAAAAREGGRDARDAPRPAAAAVRRGDRRAVQPRPRPEGRAVLHPRARTFLTPQAATAGAGDGHGCGRCRRRAPSDPHRRRHVRPDDERRPLCGCGHSPRLHEDGDGMCHAGCRCPSYQPATAKEYSA